MKKLDRKRKLHAIPVAKGLYVVDGSFEYQRNFFGIPVAFNLKGATRKEGVKRLRLALNPNQEIETLDCEEG